MLKNNKRALNVANVYSLKNNASVYYVTQIVQALHDENLLRQNILSSPSHSNFDDLRRKLDSSYFS